MRKPGPPGGPGPRTARPTARSRPAARPAVGPGADRGGTGAPRAGRAAPGWWPAPPAAGTGRGGRRPGSAPRPARARSCRGPAAHRRRPSRATQRLGHLGAGSGAQAEAGGQRGHERAGVVELGQRREPAVRPVAARPLGRQPGLADATRSEQRHQPLRRRAAPPARACSSARTEERQPPARAGPPRSRPTGAGGRWEPGHRQLAGRDRLFERRDRGGGVEAGLLGHAPAERRRRGAARRASGRRRRAPASAGAGCARAAGPRPPPASPCSTASSSLPAETSSSERSSTTVARSSANATASAASGGTSTNSSSGVPRHTSSTRCRRSAAAPGSAAGQRPGRSQVGAHPVDVALVRFEQQPVTAVAPHEAVRARPEVAPQARDSGSGASCGPLRSIHRPTPRRPGRRPTACPGRSPRGERAQPAGVDRARPRPHRRPGPGAGRAGRSPAGSRSSSP